MAKKTLEELQELGGDLIEEQRHNLTMFDHMDMMDTLHWTLPEELLALSWVQQVVSSDPHDALRDGVRLFSSHSPKLRFTPLGINPADLLQSEQIERVLVWQYENAGNRRWPLTNVIVKDAIKYARVAAQVVYLPNQFSAAGNISPKRQEAALRHGKFAVIPRNPSGVFPQWSDYMLEGVLSRRVISIKELFEFWGDAASEVKRQIGKSQSSQMEYATVYDYTDYEQRTVWVALQEKNLSPIGPDADSIVIMDEKNDLDFLPWVVRDDGKMLQPLLYSIYKGDQWNIQNILDSLSLSEVVAYAAAPRLKIISANPDAVEISYGDPNRPLHLRPGDDAVPIPPPAIDQNLPLVSDRFKARMSKSTLPNLIQSVDVPSGSAFASIREMVQLGVKALTPYKVLAESAIGDIFRQMLYWVDESGDSITVYEQVEADDVAEEYTIAKGDFDPENIYLSVELTADLPTDKVAQMNAATMFTQLGGSQYTSMDMVGIDDPEVEKQRKWDEEEEQLRHTLELQDIQFEQQLAQQQRQFEQQMAQQAQMMQMQAQMQQAAAGGQPPPPQNGTEALRNPAEQQKFAANRGSFPGGQGFNPAAGGEPPAVGDPNATRETVRERVGEQPRGPAIAAGNTGTQARTPRGRGRGR